MSDTGTGTRYTDEQKQHAFEVWYLRSSRNAAEAARILCSDDDAGFTVTRQTVHKWSLDYGWDSKADRDLFAGAPRMRFATQTELVLAAPEAARLMRQVMALDPSLKSERNIYSKDGDFIGTESYFDDKIIKLRRDAAKGCLDRTGFSPIGTRESLGAVDPPPSLDDAGVKEIEAAADHDSLRAAEIEMNRAMGIGRKS
jgi:hypothetical protein